MLFHPDAGRTIEEIIRDKWRRLPQDKKDLFIAEAERRGLTPDEWLNQCLDVALDNLEEEIKLGKFHARKDFEELPFGPDPRLNTDGAA